MWTPPGSTCRPRFKSGLEHALSFHRDGETLEMRVMRVYKMCEIDNFTVVDTDLCFIYYLMIYVLLVVILSPFHVLTVDNLSLLVFLKCICFSNLILMLVL